MPQLRLNLLGSREVRRRMQKIGKAGPMLLEPFMRKEQADLFRASQALVPVDTGALKGSGEMSPIHQRGTMVEASVSYGNTAVQYALIQHERLDFQHTSGQAKYLEQPFLQAARELPKRLGAALLVAIRAKSR